MIIGTAGHIDHGKTSLIRRLTGKDTDRLPEERRRGISIELGYAHLPIGDRVVGFVDVPGHEKFVHTMVSGASGIDYALLVIAADDGVMPQTREHIDILRLLGVNRGAIVITKIDMVDDSFADASFESIHAAVGSGPVSGWPVFPVSCLTGEGITELHGHLERVVLETPPKALGGGFRLAVDRAFSLSGVGTVVTGTAHSGFVKLGDDVLISSRKGAARVRAIHVHNQQASSGFSGQRLALNLVGVSLDEVSRGSWLASSWLENSSSRFDMQFLNSELHDRTITQGLEVHLHHGADHLMARLYPLSSSRIVPGETGLVSVVVAKPVFACYGDRMIVRDSQAQLTLGGGVVLDIFPPSRGRRQESRLNVLETLAQMSLPDSIDALLRLSPLSTERLRASWNLDDDHLKTLVGGYTRAGGTLFHSESWCRYRAALLRAVDEMHVREPEMPGLELNRCRRVACPQLDSDAFMLLIDELIGQQELLRSGAFICRPHHKAELSAAEKNLWASLSPLLQETPFNPPRVRDIAKIVNMQEASIRANLRRVSRVGLVTLVATDHFFLTESVARMADIVAQIGANGVRIRASEFRDALGGGRKVAIQILEFFDRVGYTRRVRDEHVIRGGNPWQSELR